MTRQDAIAIMKDALSTGNRMERAEAQESLTEGGYTGPKWTIDNYPTQGDFTDALDAGEI